MQRFQSRITSSPRAMPPVPAGMFALLPLRLLADLWSRRSLKRVQRGVEALRLVKVFANDA
jgi:hypothetical protein